MAENVEVEQLKGSDRLELVELLAQAFTGHPLIPALGAKPEANRAVMRALVDFFGGTEGSLLYGIRRDDKLVCASLSIDSTVEPSTLPLMKFIFSLGIALGWEAGKGLEAVQKEEPEYEGRYLELVLLGTLPAYQRQGLACKVLRFLFDEAKRQEYKGIIVVLDRNTPAYDLFLKEGFIAEKEFITGETAQCWMRLSF